MTTSITLALPYERPPKALHGNTRVHYRRRAADTRQVRADVVRLAQAAGLHRLGPVRHVEVELEWAPGDRRRRDSDNLYPLLKVCCDAIARGPRRDLVGLDVVPDDTPEHMTKHAPRLAGPPARGMWLHLLLHLDGDGERPSDHGIGPQIAGAGPDHPDAPTPPREPASGEHSRLSGPFTPDRTTTPTAPRRQQP